MSPCGDVALDEVARLENALKERLDKLMSSGCSQIVQKEFDGYRKLFTRFLNESSSAIDWERIERVSADTVSVQKLRFVFCCFP
jgi:hypothetical protein